MFSESEFEYILSEYKVIQNEKMKKHKIISVLLTITLTTILIFLYVMEFASTGPANILIPVYFGIAIFLSLIYISFSFGVGGTKAFYEFVVKKVIDKINFHMELDLVYSSNKKTQFPHNKKSGLFSRHCRSVTRMYIKGKTSEDTEFELFELSLVTSNGKNQQTHLNGIYIVLKNNTKIVQQIRTHGRPHLKGTNYSKDETDSEYRVYTKEDMFVSDSDETYLDLFSRVMRDTEKQKGYLSVIENETHFALHPFKLYKYRRLTLENINVVYDKMKWLIELVDKLSVKEY